MDKVHAILADRVIYSESKLFSVCMPIDARSRGKK